MGALYASARWETGEPIPNVMGVAVAEGIAEHTARRWWEERDRSRDGEFRRAASQAMGAAAEEGALSWYQRVLGNLRSRIDEFAMDADAWKAASAKDRGIGLANVVKATNELGKALGVVGDGSGPGSRSDRDGADPVPARVRRALRLPGG
jgi:hypothetical protein